MMRGVFILLAMIAAFGGGAQACVIPPCPMWEIEERLKGCQAYQLSNERSDGSRAASVPAQCPTGDMLRGVTTSGALATYGTGWTVFVQDVWFPASGGLFGKECQAVRMDDMASTEPPAFVCRVRCCNENRAAENRKRWQKIFDKMTADIDAKNRRK